MIFKDRLPLLGKILLIGVILLPTFFVVKSLGPVFASRLNEEVKTPINTQPEKIVSPETVTAPTVIKLKQPPSNSPTPSIPSRRSLKEEDGDDEDDD